MTLSTTGNKKLYFYERQKKKGKNVVNLGWKKAK